MKYHVALLHTSFVFIQRERMIFDLLQELLPEAQLTNIVEDTMLKQVVDQGGITPDVIKRMCLYVLAAEAMGVDAIFSTCSSLGPTIDAARPLVKIPIIKIDDAMAEKAAAEGRRIGVMATVPSTLKPTIDLVQQNANQQGKTLQIQPALCEGAFDLLSKGDALSHDQMVSAKAQEVAKWADTIVLAQCSMARLAPRLSEETGLPVLSSPRMGVLRLKAVLEGKQ